MTGAYVIPIKTVPGLNAREHWRVRAKRVKAEREATAWHVPPFNPPAIVRLIRISPGTLDDDNLQGALKAVRDEVAKLAGCDDKVGGPLQWVYAQERCRRGEFGVRVEILHI